MTHIRVPNVLAPTESLELRRCYSYTQNISEGYLQIRRSQAKERDRDSKAVGRLMNLAVDGERRQLCRSRHVLLLILPPEGTCVSSIVDPFIIAVHVLMHMVLPP